MVSAKVSAPTASSSRRHHPYTSTTTTTTSSSSSTTEPSKSRPIRTLAPAPSQPVSSITNPNPSSTTNNPTSTTTTTTTTTTNGIQSDDPQSTLDTKFPPSPPRSRRDPSESPSLSFSIGDGLSAAFGRSGGAKWWEDELPPPPASLSSILDSFRRSGEGDRDLLLSILGAKKAEEERLTALIQTRLTVLQARLSLHYAAAASLSTSQPLPSHSSHHSVDGIPSPPLAHPSSLNGHAHHSNDAGVNNHSARFEERTPSLSSTRGSESSAGSPPLAQRSNLATLSPPSYSSSGGVRGDYCEKIQLPPIMPSSIYRRTSPDTHFQPYRRPMHPSVNERPSQVRRSSTSPSPDEMRRGEGFEMLLDAGMGIESRV